MHVQRWQVDAGARPDRARLAVHVQEPLARDDVDDLVVGVAVVGRAAGRDLAHELREPGAADFRVDEQPEGAPDAGLEVGLRREAHGHVAQPEDGGLEQYDG